MDQFINDLVNDFSTHGDLHRAERQSDYMKGHFKFYGIPSPLRKQLQRPYLLRASLPPKEQMTPVVRSLWKKPERELQYFAQEMVYKYSSKFEKRDISLFEHMITHPGGIRLILLRVISSAPISKSIPVPKKRRSMNGFTQTIYGCSDQHYCFNLNTRMMLIRKF